MSVFCCILFNVHFYPMEIIFSESMKKDSRGLEFEGATVEDAIKKALDELKISRKDIIVKVVCEEQRGLFGMEGAKLAKIKIVLKRDNK